MGRCPKAVFKSPVPSHQSLLHVRPEEIFDVELQVVFGVFGQVEGGIQHAPDGDDADEVADQDAAEDGLGDIAASSPLPSL